MAAEKKKPLTAILAELSKKYDTRIGNMDEVAIGVEAISTGNLSLDAITGIGGLPKGRLTELYGPPSSGKTT